MKKQQQIWIYEYEGVLSSAVAGVKDIFAIANQIADFNQFSIASVRSLQELPAASGQILFILPSLINDVSPEPEIRKEVLRSWYEQGGLIAATCASVFWLAEAGLLNGKVATTHWRLYEQLSYRYPEIRAVDRRQMVVDQGRLLTAAGLYAFQDLVLHLIARIESYNVAREVADYALLDFNGRSQAYFQHFSPNMSHGDSVVLEAQRLCDLGQLHKLTVKALADQACVSQRTLSRRFQDVLAISPGEYLQQVRIEKSKQLLSINKQSAEQIAYEVGYQDLSNFSKAFKKIVGVTPAAYRQRVLNDRLTTASAESPSLPAV